jgi:hypothetical protein
MTPQMAGILRAAAFAGLAVWSSSAAAQSGTARPNGGSTSTPTFEQVKQWVLAYKAANPGRGGKDWDITAKTPAQIAADPAAQRLLSLCGPDQRPIIPLLAWEYGGADHRWINPEAGALVYCVYTPVGKPSSNWRYDAATRRVTADVYVKFPDQNPCKDKKGREQVAACIGDPSNFEILVDNASANDGREFGLNLAEASTQLMLILPDGNRVELTVDR